MERWQKITAGALVGGVIIGGVVFIPKLIQLHNASPELDVIPTAKIHKIDLSGLTIRLDIQLKNHTSADFKMKYPYLRLSYNGSVLGTSQSVNKDIGLPGMGEVNIAAILMHIPMLSLISFAGSFLKSVQTGKEVKVDITTLTRIDPYWKYEEATHIWKRLWNLGKKSTIPYSKSQSITLRKQQT